MKAAVTGAPADYAAAGGIIYTDNRDYPVSIFDSSGSKLFGDGYPPVYYTIDGGQCTTPSVYNCLVSATGVVRIQGSAHWGTPSEMFPTPFYPSPASPTFKPAFMMLIGSFVFLPDANGQIIRRNPSSSSVFISLDDLGDLVP